jgi:LuxR family quorum sensing-dependent transcriptional regulator
MILKISERTVKFHLVEASRKLNAVNRTSAVAKALARGLIKL